MSAPQSLLNNEGSMANYDAIAYLSDTIQEILKNGLSILHPVPTVVQSTPREFKNLSTPQPFVTLFLYHVSLYGDIRNSRSNSIGSSQVPSLPLELRYIITPWTQAANDSYKIIGAIAQILNQHSILQFNELQGEGGWNSDDIVELIFESVPVEEHYDIWEPTDMPYRLSLTYLVRPVSINLTQSVAPSPVAVATFPEAKP